MKLKVVILFIISLFLILPSQILSAPAGNYFIETINVQPAGGFKFSVGAAYEYTRGPEENEFDNWRAHPVELNYGLFRNFEIGARASYSSNSARDTGSIDNSGWEGTSIYAKWVYWQNVAISAGVKFAGSDDVFPYGNDGTDYWINVPFRIPAGPGRVIGEVGYTRKDGDDFKSYFNYGVGYIFDVDRQLSLRGELINQGKTYETGKRSLSMIMSVIYNLTERSTIVPSMEMGLKDNSPDYAAGLVYSFKFGDRGPRRQQLDDDDPGWFGDVYDQREAARRQARVYPDEEIEPPELDRDIPQRVEVDEEDHRRSIELTSQGLSAFRANRTGDAIELFQEALNFNPYNVETLYNIGTIYFHRGDLQEAYDHYLRAVEYRPDDIGSHLGLGATYLRMGQRQAAKEQFEKVLELDPTNESAQRWLQQIE